MYRIGSKPCKQQEKKKRRKVSRLGCLAPFTPGHPRVHAAPWHYAGCKRKMCPLPAQSCSQHPAAARAGADGGAVSPEVLRVPEKERLPLLALFLALLSDIAIPISLSPESLSKGRWFVFFPLSLILMIFKLFFKSDFCSASVHQHLITCNIRRIPCRGHTALYGQQVHQSNPGTWSLSGHRSSPFGSASPVRRING